jgi:hypothetical protein
MLIDAALTAAISNGALRAAKPTAPWAPEPRAFLTCKPLYDAIEGGRLDTSERARARWAQLEADIGTFVEGGLVTEKLIKQLKDGKYEHWELISRRPKPSLRVPGRFAKPDVFVGTHVVLRHEMGGMWSTQFEHEKLVCEDHWKDAGLPTVPFPGAFTDAPHFRYEAYITENARRKLEVPA